MTAIATDYRDFLIGKKPRVPDVGKIVDPENLHPQAKEHQKAITAWGVRKGRCAVWCDTGQGKSLILLDMARQLGERTLIFAPLGAAQQLVNSESPKWDIPARYARSEDEAPKDGITVTNYERLENFDPDKWGAVMLDEASILANFSGKTKRELVKRFKDTPYRYTSTATPAPNDTIELCNQADFLGVMPQQEMLSRFFTPKGAENSAAGQYKLKGHAVRDFYQWLATWAIACKTPADLGYDATGYDLPPLEIVPEIVDTDWAPKGQLFLTKLKGVTERAGVRRDTIDARIQRATALVLSEPNEQWLLWYGLLDEATRLEKSIPGLVVLRGGDTAERKAQVLLDFAAGKIQRLCTHAKVAGMGMNFQSCARMAFVGLSDSYQVYYQAIRRCWRFGQTRTVRCHVVLAEPERAVYENVLRKEREANVLTTELVNAMRDYERAELRGKRDMSDVYAPTQPIILPEWLHTWN